MFRNQFVLLLSLAIVASACGDEDGTPNPGEVAAQPASTKARVNFKGAKRIGNDLAQALSLSRSDLCKELGSYDCLEAHTILLGGVEPYRQNIHEPLPVAPLAAPMAIDRIALSACGERVSRDFADPGAAVLVAEVVAFSDGRPSDNAMSAVIERLYKQFLLRSARPEEIAALIALYDESEGIGPAQWAQLSCFAVATTTEFLFY